MSLSAVNIVISEDPLLAQEACDQIFAEAKQTGVSERNIVEVIDRFKWTDVLAESNSMSLFAELKLTDIRFAKTPNKEAQNALVELVEGMSSEDFILIRLPKLDKRQKSTKWFKAISQNAKVQTLWPPKPYEYLNWLKQRASQYSLNLSQPAIQILADQTEGNLLAANQMLQKLQLLYDEQTIEEQHLSALISDNAKYSIFLCLDDALAGKGQRAVKMLAKFKSEGVPPITILANLIREVNLCHQVSQGVVQGQSAASVLAKTFMWDSKKKLITSASQRLPFAMWQRLLARLAFLDRLIKGQEKGDIWQELESCLWLLSGRSIWNLAKTNHPSLSS